MTTKEQLREMLAIYVDLAYQEINTEDGEDVPMCGYAQIFRDLACAIQHTPVNLKSRRNTNA